MQQPKEMNSTPNTERTQGPTTRGMGSAGPQADEHGAQELPGMDAQPGPLPDMRNDPTERDLRRH
jgi:hypothetical protein